MFVVEESKVGVGAALLAIIVAKLLTPHRTSRPRPINSHNKSRHEGLDGLVLHAQPGKGEVANLMLALHKGCQHGGKRVEKDTSAIVGRSIFPVQLQVDRGALTNGETIDRFVALTCGLTPEDPWEQAKVDEQVSLAYRLMVAAKPRESIQGSGSSSGPGLLMAVNMMLEQQAGAGFLGGSGPNYADIATYVALSIYFAASAAVPCHPTILAFLARMAQVPGIKETGWRPCQKDFFFATSAAHAACVENAHEPAKHLDITSHAVDDVKSEQEEQELPGILLSTASILDGCTSFDESYARLEGKIANLKRLKNQGWIWASAVEGSAGYLTHPMAVAACMAS